MKLRKNTSEYIVNFAALLYFASIIIANQMEGTFVSVVWIATVLICAFIGLYSFKFKVNTYMVLFIIIMIFTGLLNIYFVGTTSIKDQFLLIGLFVISLLFLNSYISENILLLALIANAVIIIYRFATQGFWGQIYTTSSSNFASVHLLYPAVIYYILLEKKSRKIVVYPALIIWVLSLLARGRGGIISATLLLIGILLISYGKSELKKKILIIVLLIIIISIVFLNIDSILMGFNSSIVSEYFRNRGLQSSRFMIWDDYLQHATSSLKSLICGVNIETTYAGRYLENNPHNSFINIHMNNGILMLIIVVYLLLSNIKWAICNKEYVYVLCTVTMLLRAFTDSVFWPSYGSSVLFFLLFYIQINANKRKNEHIN